MYTIVGDGRVARHFMHYLRSLQIPFAQWSRRESGTSVVETATASTHVLLLIDDSQIEPFLRSHLDLCDKVCVHFSGSLVTELAAGTHPLMTFTESLYDLSVYPTIPFVIDEGRGRFSELLPGLPNPHYSIPTELKPFYHAMCVISGNFTSILWDKLFQEMESRLGIPSRAAFPYLERICRNLQDRKVPALTGPLARKDTGTIQKNLEALDGDPFQHVYAGFLRALGLDDQQGRS